MVRFLIGCETYLSDKKLAATLNSIDNPELNVAMFYDNFDMEIASAVATAAPFLSEKRLLVFRLSEVKGDLLPFLQSLPESTEAIVIAPKLDKRGKLYNTFKNNIEECNKLTENELLKFIAVSVKAEERNIERAAAIELAKRIHYYEDDGVNLYAVKGALKQLSCVGDITLEMVEQSLPEDTSGKAYHLSKLMCQNNGKELFRLAQYLLDCGESEIGMLSLLAKTFKSAWRDKATGSTDIPRFQYQDALKFSEKQLSEVQDILSASIAQIKECGMGSVLFLVALAKCLQVLHNKK